MPKWAKLCGDEKAKPLSVHQRRFLVVCWIVLFLNGPVTYCISFHYILLPVSQTLFFFPSLFLMTLSNSSQGFLKVF